MLERNPISRHLFEIGLRPIMLLRYSLLFQIYVYTSLFNINIHLLYVVINKKEYVIFHVCVRFLVTNSPTPRYKLKHQGSDTLERKRALLLNLWQTHHHPNKTFPYNRAQVRVHIQRWVIRPFILILIFLNHNESRLKITPLHPPRSHLNLISTTRIYCAIKIRNPGWMTRSLCCARKRI